MSNFIGKRPKNLNFFSPENPEKNSKIQSRITGFSRKNTKSKGFLKILDFLDFKILDPESRSYPVSIQKSGSRKKPLSGL